MLAATGCMQTLLALLVPVLARVPVRPALGLEVVEVDPAIADLPEVAIGDAGELGAYLCESNLDAAALLFAFADAFF